MARLSAATKHGLAIFGGAVGAVLVMVCVITLVLESARATSACTECWLTLVGGLCAGALGAWLVRRAWIAMRTTRPD